MFQFNGCDLLYKPGSNPIISVSKHFSFKNSDQFFPCFTFYADVVSTEKHEFFNRAHPHQPHAEFKQSVHFNLRSGHSGTAIIRRNWATLQPLEQNRVKPRRATDTNKSGKSRRLRPGTP